MELPLGLRQVLSFLVICLTSDIINGNNKQGSSSR